MLKNSENHKKNINVENAITQSEENKWYNEEIEDIAEKLQTNLKEGLTNEQVEKIRKKDGFNELKAKKRKSLIIRFLEQIKDFSIIILIIAAIISGITGVAQGEGITDTIIIIVVVIVNAIIGVVQESKAEKSLEALQKLSNYEVKIIREGKHVTIPARDLVVGDIVDVYAGDYVPADLRIIEAVNLKAQESSLTGESESVEKITEKIIEKVGIGDRKNMLFSSSLITYGRGIGIVVETGMQTQVGKIAGMLENSEEKETPLQKKLNELGKSLGLFAIIVCIIIFIVGILQGKEIIDMLMTAVTLAVAAIPEGLVAVSTVVLAIGVQKMAKKKAIIKKLPAVETLGCSSVICSDKTGTLTQNKMNVEKIFWNDAIRETQNIKEDEIDEQFKKLIYANVLCNDAKINKDGNLTGDPTEIALVDMAFKFDFDPSIFEVIPRIGEIPFDSERKLMTTVHEINGEYLVFSKGGIDELLKKCSVYEINNEIQNDFEKYKNRIREKNEEMARNALRVLGCAYKKMNHKPTLEEIKEIENDLIFIGMVGMIDPPREEVKDAIDKCKKAGIKTVMITGDHKITAIAIAKKLGILQDENEAITGAELENMTDDDLFENIKKYSVYARVAPEHKVRIVKAWQKNGDVVAMTGDGVNDSPALKIADIGCAMGCVGTDVAKEAADVILTDDNFTTVVSAVEEGRRIYSNILKAIQFLLSSNIGEMVVLFLATLLTPLFAKWFNIGDITHLEILLPIHMLWINLVTDSLPALAMAFEPANSNIMKKRPLKQSKSVFDGGMKFKIAYQGIMIGLLTLAAYILGLKTTTVAINNLTLDQTKIQIAQTMAFATLAFAELVHIFNVKDNEKSIFKTNIFNNLKLLGAVGISVILMLSIFVVPQLRQIFNIPILPRQNIIQVIILSLMPILIVEIVKIFNKNIKK